MNQYQTLSPFKIRDLQADIHERLGLQRTLAEHTIPVLSMEFDLSASTVKAIEAGRSWRAKVPPKVVAEIRRRRKCWHLTDEQMDDYTLQALADKHGVSTSTVVNQIREVRLGGYQTQEQAA